MPTLVIPLFAAFLVGALAQILVMLQRSRTDRGLERFRLSFLFAAWLLLVCLVPLWLAGLLTRPVLGLNTAAVALNGLGWLLTLRRPPRQAQTDEERTVGVRTYVVYRQGQPFGLVTRGAFEQLNQHGLLKKQRTVELVDDYEERARRQGVQVETFRSRDGNQTLIKVRSDQAAMPGPSRL